MLAAFGFPTPQDNLPWIVLAMAAVGFFCRDHSRKLTLSGHVLLGLLLIAFVFSS